MSSGCSATPVEQERDERDVDSARELRINGRERSRV